MHTKTDIAAACRATRLAAHELAGYLVALELETCTGDARGQVVQADLERVTTKYANVDVALRALRPAVQDVLNQIREELA